MAAGVHYPQAPLPVEPELYNVKTGFRLQGGFNLPDGEVEACSELSHIPVCCPIEVDFANHTAKIVKNAKVVEEAASGATSVKIAKHSFVKAGTTYKAGEVTVTVTAIDKSNEDYDTVTCSETSGKLKAGTVLSLYVGSKPYAVANALNYARVKVEKGATLTALGQAYEIEEALLFIPVTVADKAGLTSRFMFV